MAARANEDGGFAGDLVKQQPVATKVAFAVVFEVSDERMIAVDRRHRLAFREQVDGFREAAHVAARAFDPFNVLAELSLEDEVAHQIPSAALAALAERCRGRASIGSAIASSVSALGTHSSTRNVRTAVVGPATGSSRVTVPSAETVAWTVFRTAAMRG